VTWIEQEAGRGDAAAIAVERGLRYQAVREASQAERSDAGGRTKREGQTVQPDRRAADAAELDALRRIDVLRVAVDYGYRKDEPGSTRDSWKLRRGEGDTIIVKMRDGVGTGYFNVGDSTDRGNAVDFVQARNGGRACCPLGQARQELRRYLGTEAVVPPDAWAAARTEKAADMTALRAAWGSAGAVPRSGSYAHARHIDTATLERFSGDLKVDRRGNLLIAHRTGNGSIVGYEVKGEQYSGFAKGGRKRLAYLGDRAAPERIVVVESGLDALSKDRLDGHPAGTLYVSTGGAYGAGTAADIKRLAQRYPSAAIVAAVDNDRAGERYAQRIIADVVEARLGAPALQVGTDQSRLEVSEPVLRQAAVSRQVPASGAGKDWNEALRTRVGQDLMLKQERGRGHERGPSLGIGR